MSSAVVWLDGQEAKIFDLKAQGKIEVKDLKMHGGKGHSRHPHDAKGSHNHPEEDAFFKEVAQALRGFKETLIVGPGLAKERFKHYAESHFKSDVAKSIVGIQTVDHPTDNQVLELAREFFKSYDALH